jgi:hypothetical protein
MIQNSSMPGLPNKTGIKPRLAINEECGVVQIGGFAARQIIISFEPFVTYASLLCCALILVRRSSDFLP